jgi:hypothetical protein
MRSITKLSSIFLCLLMVAVVFAMPVNMMATDPIPDGMVSYWRFDEVSGGIAGDSADGNDGNLKPSGPWTTGQIGGALEFDGVDDYVEIQDDPSLEFGSDPYSIELWFKTSTTKDGRYGLHLISKYNGWGDNNDWHLFLYDYGGTNGQIWFQGRIYSELTLIDNSKDYRDGIWHHVVVTKTDSGTSGTKLYVDGALKDSGPGVNYLDGPHSVRTGLSNLATSNHAFPGLIDEVAIWNKALSPSEIANHWNNGAGMEIIPESSTVGLWHMNDGSGATVTDSSSKNNHGTFFNSASGPSWTTGQVGGALSFDGVDDYVDIPDDPTLELGSDPYAFELWFKTSTTKNAYWGLHLISKWDGWGDYNDWVLFLRDYGGTYGQIWFQGRLYSELTLTDNSKDYRDGIWHHVVITKTDTSSLGTKLYVDGEIKDSGPGVNILDGPNPLRIGLSYSAGNSHTFHGLIDEVAIWNRALTEEEIEDHYLSGLEGKGYFLDPEEAVEDLFEDLQIMDLPEGTENSLLSKLDTALNCLDNGNDNAASNILNAFINSVSAQSGKKLTVAQADELIAAAENILDTI